MKTVVLYGKIAAGRVALVDDEDYDLVMQYRWWVQENLTPGKRSGPYARTSIPGTRRGRKGNKKALFMHQLVVDYPKPDHIDGDGLNNQRSNLRPATPAQQIVNARRKPLNATSRYTGVSRSAWGLKWVARISYERTVIQLGHFFSEEAAALAYDKAARELYGEYARLNFPDGPPADMPEPPARYCARPDCGEPIVGRRTDARYCSVRCREVMSGRRERAKQAA